MMSAMALGFSITKCVAFRGDSLTVVPGGGHPVP